MTHSDLIPIARRWLRGQHEAWPCFAEPHSDADEIPDVWGRMARNLTGVVECKTSTADFHADFDHDRKAHRESEASMGNYRWYFAPQGVIDPDELLGLWGLLELLPDGGVQETVTAGHYQTTAAMRTAELDMLCAMVPRSAEAQAGGGKWSDITDHITADPYPVGELRFKVPPMPKSRWLEFVKLARAGEIEGVATDHLNIWRTA